MLLKRVYPELFIFGETWAYSEASQLYFAPNDNVSAGWTGNDAVTDFTLWRAIHSMYEADESEQFGSNRTYSKNNTDLGSSKANCLPENEKPWHGEPPQKKSTLPSISPFTSRTS